MRQTNPAYSIAEILIAMILCSIVLLTVFEGFLSLRKFAAKAERAIDKSSKSTEFHILLEKVCYGADSTVTQSNQLIIYCDGEIDSVNIRKDSIYIIGNDTIK